MKFLRAYDVLLHWGERKRKDKSSLFEKKGAEIMAYSGQEKGSHFCFSKRRRLPFIRGGLGCACSRKGMLMLRGDCLFFIFQGGEEVSYGGPD